MKKLLSLLIACILILSLAACGDGNQPPAPGGNSPAPTGGSAAPAGGQSTASGEADEEFVFSFASSMGAGSDFNVMVEEPFKQLIEEKSGGKWTVEIYSGGSLAAQGAAMNAVANGTADMGYDMTAIYAGTYPYNELIDIPGWVIPGSKTGSELLAEYDEQFAGNELNAFKVLAHYSTGNLGISSSKPIRSMADMSGVQLRASGMQIDWVGNLGGVGVAMPVTEVYESIKLNTIGGAILAPYAVTAFKLGEVAPYFTELPMISGFNVIVMNKELYEGMTDHDKAILDSVVEELAPIAAAYGDNCTAKAKEELAGRVEFIELSDEEIDAFAAKGMPIIEAKAEALDAAGLNGTAAYEWLLEKLN